MISSLFIAFGSLVILSFPQYPMTSQTALSKSCSVERRLWKGHKPHYLLGPQPFSGHPDIWSPRMTLLLKTLKGNTPLPLDRRMTRGSGLGEKFLHYPDFVGLFHTSTLPHRSVELSKEWQEVHGGGNTQWDIIHTLPYYLTLAHLRDV